jgi:hypothetical protein
MPHTTHAGPWEGFAEDATGASLRHATIAATAEPRAEPHAPSPNTFVQAMLLTAYAGLPVIGGRKDADKHCAAFPGGRFR